MMKDATARRVDVVEATWRVIRRSGVEGASVRAVATEAGVAMGSLRHLFGTQAELYTFAMRALMDRLRERVASLPRPRTTREGVEAVLSEFLPLDEERRAESEVWLAFTARALVDPELHAVRSDAFAGLEAVCAAQVGRLWPGLGGAELRRETRHLNALLDGLLLHGVIAAESCPPGELRAVLAAHLDALGDN